MLVVLIKYEFYLVVRIELFIFIDKIEDIV